MPITKTKEEFIKESIEVHGYRYDYSLVNYKNNKTKVSLICEDHGVFNQIPKDHLNGSNCPKCAKGSYDSSEFIKKITDVHKNRYDYTNTIYKGSKEKISFICKSCNNEIEMLPNNHLNGQGCKKCKLKKSLTYDKDRFIKISKDKHGDKYNYDNINYINSKTKVKILCELHGYFLQEPSSHMRGNGCKECASNKYKDLYRKTQEKFIEDSIRVHGNEYSYSMIEYVNSKNNVEIKCRKHGSFNQLPHNHLSGSGCPICKSSKGEKKIYNFLSEKGFVFSRQKKFENCTHNKNDLFFDFYLPEYNICIEYDGVQHFEPIDYFGGYGRFIERRNRDIIKNEYCKSNGINLIRIPYTDYDNITNILSSILVFI